MNINVCCPINSLGYGIASLNIVDSLHKNNNKVSLFPIGGKNRVEAPEEYHQILEECVKRSQFYDKNAPCIRIYHQFELDLFVGKGEHIGFPFFELDEFTERELHNLNSVDRLFVASKWAMDVCIAEGVKVPIDVVTLGVDTSIFKPQKSRSGTTVFVNIGKWEVRKGHDILVDAFCKAFNEDDPVELWMVNHNPFYSAEENKWWADKYLNSPLGSKIRIIPRQETQHDLARLMQKADCGVFPSRGEGWNLEALEMMACGKHVIITDYSAHTQFCNSSNALLVDVKGLEPAFDGKWFNGQGRWAMLGQREVDQIVAHMRTVHQSKQEGSLSRNEAGICTAGGLTWNNTANQIVSALE